MHDDDKPASISIELHGGPLGGRVWTGPSVPTTDGYPMSFAVTVDMMTILASGFGVVATVMEIPIGFYSPTRASCESGHVVYIWEMQETRWN